MSHILHNVGHLERCVITKRPSLHIKSPFVADIDIGGDHALAHTPSLGCCGLAEKDKVVWVTKLDGDRAKCQYRVLLSELESQGYKQYIGIAPKLSEKIAEAALRNHLVQGWRPLLERKLYLTHALTLWVRQPVEITTYVR